MDEMDQSPSLIDLRTAPARLRGRVLALNNAHAAETSELDAEGLDALLGAAFFAPATPDGGAFLIALDETAEYLNPNFLWFRERCAGFVYVDRVVVSPSWRGRGLARRLYDELARHALAARRALIACEVNREPPNPASDAFHAALGFREIGRGRPKPDRLVRYLLRDLSREASR